jgi:hypothetical protein
LDKFVQIECVVAVAEERARQVNKYMDSVPVDIWATIFTFLTTRRAAFAARVCEQFRIVFLKPLVWRDLVLEYRLAMSNWNYWAEFVKQKRITPTVRTLHLNVYSNAGLFVASNVSTLKECCVYKLVTANLKKLRLLDYASTRTHAIKTFPLHLLQQAPNLEELTVSDFALFVGVEFVASLKCLHTLYVDGVCKDDDFGYLSARLVEQFSPIWPRLQSLTLNRVRIHAVDRLMASMTGNAPKLRHLCIATNCVYNFVRPHLDCPELTSVHLSGYHIRFKTRPPRLEKIELHRIKARDVLREWATNNFNVHTVSLERSDFNLKLLQDIRDTCPSLKRLILGDTHYEMDDFFAAHIGGDFDPGLPFELEFHSKFLLFCVYNFLCSGQGSGHRGHQCVQR